ncbi:hypothetical protein BBH99_00310 [Chryseobacterium contaminans]|uniref:GIY-YIG domain-containing protein n=1 Tax=Chryseobacterium contaminans TaxID=1423959 RepID=A0A1M6VPI4_9FLAO|nr:hypothetical protein [Chryseobacterium contaminans]OCA80580.1 hypothetical protein BBH99_00310 [Chryseobacterium contaminans]SHK83146.1 hypothetical protein SAMN05444407_101296 [Chryseobacterium contaminans]
MLQSAFDLGEHLKLREVTFKVSPLLWQKWDITELDLNFSNWNKIKFLNDTLDGFHPDIDSVPNDKGGLYLFYVSCQTISGITEIPFYIGRAQITEGQNLRKRVREYFNKFCRNNERPKITRMFNYWKQDLYLAYYELDDNLAIVDLEKKLINSLLLPMNDEIPDLETRQAVKAF